jgi:hypothetical protein
LVVLSYAILYSVAKEEVHLGIRPSGQDQAVQASGYTVGIKDPADRFLALLGAGTFFILVRIYKFSR